MLDRRGTAPALADAAVLAVALERDGELPGRERGERDREIGRSLGTVPKDRAEAALSWLDERCEREDELAGLRERARVSVGWISFAMVLGGLLSGWAAALGTLYYDGSGRVNVVAVLAVFVFLPALLLIPLLIAALPSSMLGWLPGAEAGSLLFRSLSPGRFAGWLFRRLPRDHREVWLRIGGRAGSRNLLYAGVRKWALIRWSQLFAVGFQIAAVTVAVYLVAFSDLAFGWSTTLTTGDAAEDSGRLHEAVSVMAAPWAWAWEAGSPSFELVAQSRYYRAVKRELSPAEAAFLGGWWPFLILSMLFYGLLPRWLAFTWANRRLRGKLHETLAATPGVSALIARLHRAGVETRSIEEEWRGAGPTEMTGEADRARLPPDVAVAINWSAVPLSAEGLAQLLPNIPLWQAGGASTMEEDRALVEKARGERDAAGSFVIIVKSWEPPLLEFVDFVKALREALGPGRDLLVVPVAVGEKGQAEPPPLAQAAVWRAKLEQVGDPWLRVVELSSEVVE